MPTLTVIAGSNGAGKTRLSAFFNYAGFIDTDPINVDQINKKIDETFLSNDFFRVEEQRRKQVNKIFLEEAEKAIALNANFCFESNISTNYQISPIKLFDDAGYKLHLIYIVLDDIEKSQERVNKRSSLEKGHFVSEETILINFNNGLSILNETFNDWDRVFLIDNSNDMDISTNHPEVLLVAEKGNLIFFNHPPPSSIQHALPTNLSSINNVLNLALNRLCEIKTD